jgi:hypothetical protein
MKISHRSLSMSVNFHGQDKDFLKYCKLLKNMQAHVRSGKISGMEQKMKNKFAANS